MADGEKRITRSQSTQEQSSWLGIGNYFPYGREARAVRSPHNSPRPTPSPQSTSQQVFFPSPESNSLPPTSHPRDPSPRLQLADNNMADSTALSSLSTALSGLQVSSRKPELPPFDKTSIEKWIRRVESSYIRSGITLAREKFAFIESKFPVDEDPAVDEFLFGPPTDENWEAFTTYLTKRYGKTKRQKVSAILEPIKMDGRTPSQYFAKLRQGYDDITLDDIVKEICVRQLPVDLQQTICKDTESLSAKEMMSFADKYYNPDGSRIHKKPASVNAIQQPNYTAAPSFSQPFSNDDNNDDNVDVNAIRGRSNFRPQQGGGGFGNGRSKSRGRFGNNNNNNNGGFSNNKGGHNNNNNNGGGQRNGNRQNDPALCFYHNMYGDRARKCDFGCAKNTKSGNGQSPRQ